MKPILIIAAGGVVLGSLLTFVLVRSPEPNPTDPLGRSYQECRPCGLSGTEIDALIDTMRHSTLSRDGNLELFYATFDRREDAKICQPCARAILRVAMDDSG